ncbi:MAG: hypothetical protein Q9222_001740 [Ikaeria aurantiellina]
MPTNVRKRGAQVDSEPTTPAKRTRSAKFQQPAADDEVNGSSPIQKNSTEKGLRRNTPKKATKSTKLEDSEVDASDAQVVKTEQQDAVDRPAQSATSKSRAAAKTNTTHVKQASPQKSKKRKATQIEEEDEEEQAKKDDDEPSPKTPKPQNKPKDKEPQPTDDATTSPQKPKTKRKTKEEKEAEAMPLAARTAGLRMHIGAHVSGAKGVQNAVTNCVHIGGNAFALFLKSQRKWDNPPLQDENRDAFRSNCIEHEYDATSHIVPHGSYLVNLAQEDPEKAKQAYDSFLEDLHRCESLGIKLYNFHPGTTNNAPRPSAIARIASALNRAHTATKTVTPLLETMAGSNNTLGSTFADLASIIALVTDKSRIGVCLDTCHLFAAGYDLRSPATFKAVLTDFDKTVGLKYVKALHLNDSKAPFSSRRDLHANIGTGFLGLRAFWNVVNERRFEGLPMVLETPIDRKVGGGAEDGKAADGGVSDEEEGGEEQKKAGKRKGKGKKKGPAKKPPPPKEKTIEDKGIWAREIKLLESLIGMDTEGEEFKKLEKELADEGAEERKKHQEAFERKLVKEQKAKTKDIGSFLKKGKGEKKTNGKVGDSVEEAGSPLSELSEPGDSPEK